MHAACAAPNLIRIKYHFRIVLAGIKSLEKLPGPSRVGHFFKILQLFGQIDHPYQFQKSLKLILHPYNATLKGIFIWIKFGAPQI